MKTFYHRIRRLFKRKRGLTRAEIERRLGPEGMAALKSEADFLKNTYAVKVASLAEGETPTTPRAADPLVEKRFNGPTPEE